MPLFLERNSHILLVINLEKPIPKRIYVRQFRFSLNGSIQLKNEHASTKEMRVRRGENREDQY